MHEYDTVLKAVLENNENTAVERITGLRIEQWLNVEFTEVQQMRVDILGATAGRERLVGLELQSTNDMKLPLRMAEYALRIYRRYDKFPDQYVLYVGNAKIRMPSELVGDHFYCRYKIVDIRELDEEALLLSPFDGDNILAILTAHRDRQETIRRILERIATLEGGRRDAAFKRLLILAGLRKLADSVRAEVKHMPILDDIMDHDVIGPAIRQGQAQGREEGRQEGRQEGEQAIIRRQVGKRFGAPPAWLDERLSKLSVAELEEVADRLLDAKSIDELFA